MGIAPLDIFIGLSFVYLIHSLYITIFSEMVSTWFGMRGRMLRQGITYLLTDLKILEEEAVKARIKRRIYDKSKVITSKEPPPKSIRGNGKIRTLNDRILFIENFFLFEHKYFKGSKAEEFYDQPSIKFLAQGVKYGGILYHFRKSKPSYISKENFSSTLVNMLRKKGVGIHDWAKVSYSIKYNACFFEPETHKQLVAFLNDADDDMEALKEILERWFEDMMQRINGWYKRKMRLIVFLLGILSTLYFNLNSLIIIEKLNNDQKATRSLVLWSEEIIDKGKNITTSPATRPVNELAIQNQSQGNDNNQSDKESIPLDKEKVEEYINGISDILGPGWGASDDLDTIKLEVNAIDPILASAKSVLIEKKNLEDFRNELNDSIKSKAKILISNSDSSLELNEEKKEIEGQEIGIQEINSIDALLQKYDSIYKQYTLNLNNLNSLLKGQKTNFQRLDSYILLCEESDEADNVCENFSLALVGSAERINITGDKLGSFFYQFLGLFMTMLALSLGAPFWFDLLRKLIALRGTGVRPSSLEEKKQKSLPKSSRSDLGKTITSGDKIDEFLYNYSSRILEIPGIIAVNKSFISPDKNSKKLPYSAILVSYVKDFSKEEIENEVKMIIGARNENESQPINIDFEEIEVPRYSTGKFRFNNSKGTIAGVVKHRPTNRLVALTCAHTISMYNSSFIYDGSDTIEDLGKITEAYWCNLMDAAIIQLNDPTKNDLIKLYPPFVFNESHNTLINKNKFKVQVHTYDDLTKKIVKKNGLLLQINQGFPFLDRGGEKYFHRGIMKIFLNKENHTKAGDSGALITYEDENGEIYSIGINIGGAEKSEKEMNIYAIPMTSIFELFNLEPIKN